MLFIIPNSLRQYSGGRSDVRIDAAGGTLEEALARLWSECPGVRERVLNERGEIRPHVNVFVDGENARQSGGLSVRVRPDAEVVIVPAVSGGAARTPPARCAWAATPLSIAYHDAEWGRPVHDDLVFFEFITLEGAQAGLSWETILKKRDGYRDAFAGFDPAAVARFTPARVERLMQNAGIVRNRLKIESTIRNARAFLNVQREVGSFDAYVWRFVNGRPILNRFSSLSEIPARTPESDALSRDLQGRGFKFVGSTICYAFMQATGLVNDHVVGCFRHGRR